MYIILFCNKQKLVNTSMQIDVTREICDRIAKTKVNASCPQKQKYMHSCVYCLGTVA